MKNETESVNKLRHKWKYLQKMWKKKIIWVRCLNRIQKKEIIIYHFSDYYGDVYEKKRSQCSSLNRILKLRKENIIGSMYWS